VKTSANINVSLPQPDAVLLSHLASWPGTWRLPVHAARATGRAGCLSKEGVTQPEPKPRNSRAPHRHIEQCLPAGAGAEVMGDEDY
jgi:hypothetical protein